jgi:hypothetical protein
MSEIDKLEIQTPKYLEKYHIVQLGLRPIDEWAFHRQIFATGCQISGVHCVISVKSDKWYNNLDICLQTMAGDSF